MTSLYCDILWGVLILVLVAWLMELAGSRPPPRKRKRTGIWVQDDARGVRTKARQR
jgi:high-affinity Fe2+/Pb2+ permease